MNAFEVHCTWEAVDGKSLHKAVSWLDSKESSDIEDIIQAENCLLLEASEEEPDCKLHLSCASPSHRIHRVAVLSEARVTEVFGNHREYLETVRGGVVDEMDDMIVYRGDIPFEYPLRECTIKFAALKNKSKMWLYGVVAKVQTDFPPPVGRGVRAVPNERLQDPGYTQLAAQLLQMVTRSAAPPDNKTDRGSQTEHVRQEKDTQTLAEEKVETPTDLQPAAREVLPTAPEALERLSESISASVECSLEQMEQRLWAKVQQCLQDMEQRIDYRIQEIVDALKDDDEEDDDDEPGEEVAL